MEQYDNWSFKNLSYLLFKIIVFAGIATWAFVMPFDVVKSRIQADDLREPEYKGMVDCFRKTYRKYGLAFFQRGFVLVIARAIPVNAATFSGYEAFIYLYKEYLASPR